MPGRCYNLKDGALTPVPVQKPYLPAHIGSEGSEEGLKRVAKYGDGGMASAYNIMPAKFKEKWNFLLTYRKSLRKNVDSFENSIMTMFGYIDEDRQKIRSVVRDTLAPALGRPAEDLESMLLFGSADESLRKVADLVEAGVKRIHFWPVKDYEGQIRVFKKEMASLASFSYPVLAFLCESRMSSCPLSSCQRLCDPPPSF